jgi:hypothetical protein
VNADVFPPRVIVVVVVVVPVSIMVVVVVVIPRSNSNSSVLQIIQSPSSFNIPDMKSPSSPRLGLLTPLSFLPSIALLILLPFLSFFLSNLFRLGLGFRRKVLSFRVVRLGTGD